MRKQYSERSIYDNYLKQLDNDKDIIWNRKRKDQVRSKIIFSINKLEQKTKIQTGFKYVSSFGVFIVLLLFGYQLFLSDINNNGEEVSTEPQDNQTQNFLVVDDSDEEETANGSDEDEEDTETEMGLRLPKYIPSQVTGEPQYKEREYSEGRGLTEVTYMDSESYFLHFSQSKMVASKEEIIEKVKNEMYADEVLEEIEISDQYSFLLLEGDTSYYSSLHIITDKYFITLSTHGFEKEEILKIANSIDLTGL